MKLSKASYDTHVMVYPADGDRSKRVRVLRHELNKPCKCAACLTEAVNAS